MDDKSKPRKKAGAILAVLVLLSPMLYVASAGPAAAWVVESYDFNDDSDFVSRARMYERVYAPLIAVEDRSEPLHAAIKGWRSLFVDDDGEYLWEEDVFYGP